MFPTKANDPYIKKDGTRSTVGNVIGSGGGSSDIPEYTSADAGKVLTVDVDGSLSWNTPAVSGNRYTKDVINSDQSNVIISESEVV